MDHNVLGLSRMERRPNWTEEEVKTLQMAVSDRRHILYSRQIASHNMKKKEAWREIATLVQGIGRADRTAHECRRKYADFTSRLRKKAGTQRRSVMGFGYQRVPVTRLRAAQSVSPVVVDDATNDKMKFDSQDDDDVVPIKIECDSTPQWTLCDVSHSSGSVPEIKASRISSNDANDKLTTVPIVHSRNTVHENNQSAMGLSLSTDNGPLSSVPSQLPPTDVSSICTTSGALCANGLAPADIAELERKRLQVEQERLFIERERLVYEKQAMNMAAQRLSVEQQMLIVQQERLAVERERLTIETQQLAINATRR